MRSHVYTEQRKTVQIPSTDLLQALGIDPTIYEVAQASALSGGFHMNDPSPVIELILREKVKHEARK